MISSTVIRQKSYEIDRIDKYRPMCHLSVCRIQPGCCIFADSAFFFCTGVFHLTHRPSYSRPPSRRLPAVQAPRLALWLLLIVIVCGGGWYILRSRSIDASVRRGLTLLNGAQSSAEIDAALARWESEFSDANRAEQVVAAILDRYPISDKSVHELLVHAAGADYGDRADDWKRWRDAQRRLRKGEQPKLQSGERVRLEERWATPVGLTAWFSTILPLDGKIYVASLGSGFEIGDDQADGVVRVDGANGTAEFIFRPQLRSGSDIIGIAAGTGRIFVATRGGMIYAIDLDGGVLWDTNIDSVVFAPPLSLDVNHDGADDVIVATRSGRVIALNGSSGKTIWSLGGSRRARADLPDDLAACTVLAAGHILSENSADILVTYPDATVRVLLAASGAPKFEQSERTGFLSGSVVCGDRRTSTPRAYLADRDARVWSLTQSGRKLELVPTWLVADGATIIATPRTIDLTEDAAPVLLACTSGAARGGGAAAMLDATGIRWRFVTDGAVWSTPVIANLHRDREKENGKPEIIVSSVATDAQGDARGTLLVLSIEGHVLRSMPLSAPADAAPVICDVDGDQKLDLLIADRAGMLHCYSTDGVGPVEWGMFLGDSHNTSNSTNAYSFGQTPFGYQSRWRPGF